MKERDYQSYLIRELKRRFPGCVVLKNDPDYMQGVPDLTILYGTHWACLEVKASENAREQANQRYYIRTLGRMSFASFIFPENEEDVFHALQHALRPEGYARVSER